MAISRDLGLSYKAAFVLTRGSVFTTEDCEEYLARLPDVYKREVIRSFKEHRPLDRRHLVTRRCNYPPALAR
jgi:hypothetical protein